MSVVNEDETIEVWNQAINWRGLLIQRYAGIEFALSQLIMVARDHHAYNSLGDMPFRFETKLNRLDKICNLPGPMSVHKTKFAELIKEVRLQLGKRHFTAHALMNVSPRVKGKNVIIFSMYDHQNCDLGKSVVHAGQWPVDYDKRDEYTALITSICSRFTQLATEACEIMKNDASSTITPKPVPPPE